MGEIFNSEANFLRSKADATLVEVYDAETPLSRIFAPELSVKHI
jgi:hypothetical protein